AHRNLWVDLAVPVHGTVKDLVSVDPLSIAALAALPALAAISRTCFPGGGNDFHPGGVKFIRRMSVGCPTDIRRMFGQGLSLSKDCCQQQCWHNKNRFHC